LASHWFPIDAPVISGRRIGKKKVLWLERENEKEKRFRFFLGDSHSQPRIGPPIGGYRAKPGEIRSISFALIRVLYIPVLISKTEFRKQDKLSWWYRN
jgi:hypothetical protein